MWRSIIVFLFAYVAIATGRINKAVAAVLGGCALIALGGVSQDAAYAHVDLKVIFLLLGMMVLVNAVAETGFFQYVALALAKGARGNPLAILLALVTATGVLSAFLDNVTTILLIAPVTILIADQLELDPIPLLIMEAVASNIGGTATLIGDPPNVVIGARVGLSFNEFILNLGPAVVVCFALLLLGLWLIFRKRLHVPQDVRARVRDADPAAAITDRGEAARVLGIMGLVIVGFFLHDVLHLDASVVALGGAMLVLVVTKKDAHEAFGKVEWPTLMFFVGLFILVAGLEEQGVLAGLAAHIVGITRGNPLATVLVVLWGGALASAFVDNVPFVAAMIPVVHAMIPAVAKAEKLADPSLIEQPLWWALALGACLGGNATLVGASSNIVMAGVAERNGHKIGFARFASYGIPAALMSLAVSSVYLWVRYFLLADWPA